jgi:hypothetical protein
MHDSEVGSKSEITVLDAYDHAMKLRKAIGYVADSAFKDPQLNAVLWTIEDSAQILEGMLQYLVTGGRSPRANAAQ